MSHLLKIAVFGFSGLAVLVLGFRSDNIMRQASSESRALTLREADGEVRVSVEAPFEGDLESHRYLINPKQPIQQEIAAGSLHTYQLELEVGQYLHAVVDQHGVDVIVQLFDPNGQMLKEVDSPNGSEGPEELIEIAQTPGLYRLEIRAPEGDAEPGRYTLNIEALRRASRADRNIVAADRIFEEAERLLAGRPKLAAAALKKYREALALQERPRQRPRKADILYGIGRAHESLGERQQALGLYKEALTQYRDLGDQDRGAALLNRSARVHQWFGDLDMAFVLYQEALALFEVLGDEIGVVIVLNRLGAVHNSSGEIQMALDAFEKALQKSRALGDRRREAIALTNLGHALLTLDRNREAWDAFSQALEINEIRHDRKDIAINLKGLADTAYQMAKFDDAVEFLQRSLQIRQDLDDLRGQAVALNTLGEIYLRQGKIDRAGASLQEALQLARHAGEPHSQAIVLTNMGLLYVTNGEARRGLALYDEALDLFQSIGDFKGEASSLAGGARALRDLSRFTESLDRIEKAIDKIESLRARAQRQDLQISYFAFRQDYYEIAVDVLMHLHELNPSAGYDAQAVHTHERRLARSMLDALAESRVQSNNAGDTSFIETERALQRRLNVLAGLSSSSTDPKRLEKQITRLVAELDKVQGEIRRTNPRYANLSRRSLLSVPEIQRKILDEETLLIVYALGETRSFLWVISHEDLISHILPGRAEIEGKARKLSQLLSKDFRRQYQARLSYELSEILLDPIAPNLDGHRLVFVTEGSLQSLAFSALPNPNDKAAATPLVVSHEIIHLPSASVLVMLRQRSLGRPMASNAVAVLADPVYDTEDSRFRASEHGSSVDDPIRWQADLDRAARDVNLDEFKRLPYSQIEAAAILAMVPKDQGFQALGFAVDRRTVTSQQLRDYRILHFATHALLNRQHPELSGLVLSLLDQQGRRQDGFLRVHEIYNLDFPVELVVLSACQTGLGKDVRGEGLLGLARGFLYAGASRVLVSLWKVSDRGTAELMIRFYQAHFKDGLSPAAALRAAQVSMLQDPSWSAPRYWAGFNFQGEWHDIAR